MSPASKGQTWDEKWVVELQGLSAEGTEPSEVQRVPPPSSIQDRIPAGRFQPPRGDHWPTTTEEASADRPHPSPARQTFARGAPSSFLSFGSPASVEGDVTRKEIVGQKLDKERRKQTT